MKREKSCGVIIFKRNGKLNYLLLHYEAGHWDFVKGRVEAGEDEQETVKREAEEEAGLKDLSFVKDFKERIAYFYKQDKELISKEVVFYLAETKTSEVKISFEHVGFEWLPYKEAKEKLTFKTAKDVLEKANAFLEKLQKQKKLGDY